MECLAYLRTNKSEETPPSRSSTPPLFRGGAGAFFNPQIKAPTLPLERGSTRRGRELIFLFLLLCFQSTAQTISIDDDALRDYNAGLEHVQKKKYAAAQQRFNKALENPHLLSSIELENAEYYSALCAMELFNDHGDKTMETFVNDHPEHAKVQMAYFHLGRFAHTKRKFRYVLHWFSKVDEKKLTKTEQNEFHFKKGYANFQKESYEKAVAEFALVKYDIESPYYAPITYYSAYIQFKEGLYDEAYEGFSLLEGDETFGKIVPLYILQILQAQGKDEEVIEYGERLMGKNFSGLASGNLHKMIGEAYYQMGEFSMAVPYLEEAYTKLNWDRDEVYRLAFACYKAGKFEKAASYFEQCVKEQDEMAQLAYYQMADSYLKTGDKHSARNAFKLASEMEFDAELQETAIFNYAKLSFELSYDPNNEAITAFEKYVDSHLGSERADEAQELIMKVHLSTGDYEGALATIGKIRKKTNQQKAIYQQTALKRGKELFNDGNFERSLRFFKMANEHSQDKLTSAKSLFWKAEALANLGQHQRAIDAYNEHIVATNADRTEVFKLAHYGLAYVHFEKEDEANAITAYRKYLELEKYDALRINDAYLHIADCYYVTKNTGKAIAYYNKAIGMNGQETDYALFQVAMCYGLQSKSRSKISKLKSLISSYPNSEFVVDAKYEIGETYFFSDSPEEAVTWFDKVSDEHPQSQYAGRSILNKALVFYNRNEDEVALPLFKQVANDYPGTSEASEALGKIQKIYVEGGNVRQFEDYLSNNSFPDATKGSLDTSYYEAAQLMYQRGEMVSAMQEFEKYLKKFPNGYFALDAHYFKAEIALDLKKYDQALTDFNQVLEYAKTSYTERALVAAAQIHMYQKEFGQAQLKYAMLEEIAERSENKLEARIGLMRTYFRTEAFELADDYTQKILRSDRVEKSLKDEANLISAKCALGMDNLDIALAKFQQTANQAQNVVGAEAKYSIALIHHQRSDFEKSQETIFEMVNQFANYENWVGKSFLLLAKNYVEQDDLFQAKLTLQNVVDNYKDEIQKQAQSELKKIEKFEAFSKAE